MTESGTDNSLPEVQRAEVSLMVAKESGFRARAEIANRGLLSVAVLVSSISPLPRFSSMRPFARNGGTR